MTDIVSSTIQIAGFVAGSFIGLFMVVILILMGVCFMLWLIFLRQSHYYNDHI
jgi:hypothetical protein